MHYNAPCQAIRCIDVPQRANMPNLNERIRKARKYADLTQQALSEELSVSIRALKNYEKDAGKVTVSLVQNIALACGVNEIWLLTGYGDMVEGVASFKRAANSEEFEDDEIIREHIEIVRQFEDKLTAKEINLNLREIEVLDRAEFKDAAGYLRGVANMLKKRNQEGRQVGKKAVNGQ